MEQSPWKGSGSRERVLKFKLELHRYLEVMKIEGYGDVDMTFR